MLWLKFVFLFYIFFITSAQIRYSFVHFLKLCMWFQWLECMKVRKHDNISTKSGNGREEYTLIKLKKITRKAFISAAWRQFFFHLYWCRFFINCLKYGYSWELLWTLRKKKLKTTLNWFMLFIMCIIYSNLSFLRKSNPYKTHWKERKKNFFRNAYETYDDINFVVVV